jgi:hypothetical protein
MLVLTGALRYLLRQNWQSRFALVGKEWLSLRQPIHPNQLVGIFWNKKADMLPFLTTLQQLYRLGMTRPSTARHLKLNVADWTFVLFVLRKLHKPDCVAIFVST